MSTEKIFYSSFDLNQPAQPELQDEYNLEVFIFIPFNIFLSYIWMLVCIYKFGSQLKFSRLGPRRREIIHVEAMRKSS
jgi:hypothetical protein